MTEQEISKYMSRLQEEGDMSRRDKLLSFDGSKVWMEFTERLAREILESPQSSDPEASGEAAA